MNDRRPAEPPHEAERPVPLEAAPEGTSRPEDWDVSGGTTENPDGPAGERGTDDVLAEREQAQRDDRAGRASGAVPEGRPEGSQRESGYSTEGTQGAAQPGPHDDGQHDS